MNTIMTMILDWVIVSAVLALIFLGVFEIRNIIKENKS